MMKVSYSILFFLIALGLKSFGQTEIEKYQNRIKLLQEDAKSKGFSLLPKINVNWDNKIGTVVSWYNSYEMIENIAIQRSTDSTFNFKTIGYTKKNKQGIGHFVDKEPLLGKSYYRLLILFNGELNWYSDLGKMFLDSMQFEQFGSKKSYVNKDNANTHKKDMPAEVKPETTTSTDSINIEKSNDDLKKLVSIKNPNNQKGSGKNRLESTVKKESLKEKMPTNMESDIPEKPKKDVAVEVVEKPKEIQPNYSDPLQPNFIFQSSKSIYYNSISKQIHVDCFAKDIDVNTRSIKFLDPILNTEIKVLEKLPNKNIVIDRRNFIHDGLIKFVISKNGKISDIGFLLL